MSNLLEERLDGIEARIERLEKLYGIDHTGTGPQDTMVIYWSDQDKCYHNFEIGKNDDSTVLCCKKCGKTSILLPTIYQWKNVVEGK
jgi:hypothetical protein